MGLFTRFILVQFMKELVVLHDKWVAINRHYIKELSQNILMKI